jgi:hypothetical protein
VTMPEADSIPETARTLITMMLDVSRAIFYLQFHFGVNIPVFFVLALTL